jgi:hypothetical protein
VGPVAQSVQRLGTGWTVRGSKLLCSKRGKECEGNCLVVMDWNTGRTDTCAGARDRGWGMRDYEGIVTFKGTQSNAIMITHNIIMSMSTVDTIWCNQGMTTYGQ